MTAWLNMIGQVTITAGINVAAAIYIIGAATRICGIPADAKIPLFGSLTLIALQSQHPPRQRAGLLSGFNDNPAVDQDVQDALRQLRGLFVGGGVHDAVWREDDEVGEVTFGDETAPLEVEALRG